MTVARIDRSIGAPLNCGEMRIWAADELLRASVGVDPPQLSAPWARAGGRAGGRGRLVPRGCLELTARWGLERVRRDGELSVVDEPNASCCYAKSDKHWVTDPQGIAWETFHTLADIPTFGEPASAGTACCTPTAAVEAVSGAAKSRGCCA